MPRPHIAAVLCLFLLGVGASAAPARAIGDEWGTPPRICSEAESLVLEAAVALHCRQRDELSCLFISGCFNLRRTRDLLVDCLNAVDALNLACYGGALIELRVEALSLDHQIGICSERIAMRPPIGCGRPCPL